MCAGEGIYTMKGEWYFQIFLGNFRLVSKTKRSRIKKVCILNIPAKQNICCGSRNVFYMQARLPAGWGRACYWVSAFRKLYEVGLIHWTTKNQRCNCHGKKEKKTYNLCRKRFSDILCRKSYIDCVYIVAAVQEFEMNLWVKDKYERTKHNMQRTYRWSLDRGKKCEREEEDETGVEMHFRRVER